MNYKPLPSGFTIKKSEINGLGLFATEDITKGILGIGWVKHEQFPNGYVRTPLGGFINHSSRPNCTKIVHEDAGVIWLKAIKNIKSDEELTLKYSLYKV